MRYVLAVLAALGILVSSLSIVQRFGAPPRLIDLVRSTWNCAYVNQSSYAVIRGVPVAAVGIILYLTIGVLALLGRRVLTAFCANMGLIYAMYLTAIEVHFVHFWCIHFVVSLILMVVITILALADLIFAP